MELKIELQQSLKNCCFTCLRQSEECMPISSEASVSDSVSESVTIVELLTKHFWFQQDNFNKQQHVICWSCWNRLDEFHRFYQEVEQNHRILNQAPPKINSYKVEPMVMDDEDSNDLYEIQHDEVELKEENWVESEEEGFDKGSKPESSSEGENGGCEPEESPLGVRVPRHSKAKQESSIGKPVVTQQANKPVRDLKQWADDDEFIKTHVQYICLVCKNNCPSFSQLERHMMNVHEMSGFITCCGKRYYKKLNLLDHVQRLQDPDRFKCDICHKIFINSSSLRKHTHEIHATDEQKTYCCDRCPRRFVRASLLEYHLKGHNNLEKGNFKCPHCEKPFSRRYLMNAHVKVNHAGTSFFCEVCEKGFVTKQYFLRHKEQHELPSEKLRVQCDVCHKWLKNKNSLRSHYQRHTKPSVPVTCDICGHVALNSPSLLIHKRIQHVTEPNFACQKCDKKFQRPSERHKHRILNCVGTLYPCNLCDKNFVLLDNMKSHQRITHPKEWSEQNTEAKDP